jgi:hypothetical protein
MDHRSHADDTIAGDLGVIGDATIHVEKAILSYFAVTGHDHVRRNEDVILDYGLMANVIAAPKDDVVANLDRVLDDIVLEDEAVLADLDVSPDESLLSSHKRQGYNLSPWLPDKGAPARD